MLHDERYFSHPDSFIPERWIESERGDESCVKEAWVSFGYGKWRCIGKPFAYSFECANRRLAMMVLRVAVAKLIWNYDIWLKSVEQAEPIFDHKTVSAGRLEVRLKRMERK